MGQRSRFYRFRTLRTRQARLEFARWWFEKPASRERAGSRTKRQHRRWPTRQFSSHDHRRHTRSRNAGCATISERRRRRLEIPIRLDLQVCRIIWRVGTFANLDRLMNGWPFANCVAIDRCCNRRVRPFRVDRVIPLAITNLHFTGFKANVGSSKPHLWALQTHTINNY